MTCVTFQIITLKKKKKKDSIPLTVGSHEAFNYLGKGQLPIQEKPRIYKLKKIKRLFFLVFSLWLEFVCWLFRAYIFLEKRWAGFGVGGFPPKWPPVDWKDRFVWHLSFLLSSLTHSQVFKLVILRSPTLYIPFMCLSLEKWEKLTSGSETSRSTDLMDHTNIFLKK